MPDLGPYTGFILGSYALTTLILGWMIIGSWLEARHARIRLARIEAAREDGLEGKSAP